MIDVRSMQEALKVGKFYKGKIDGDFGRKSLAARDAMLKSVVGPRALSWPSSRKGVALQQWLMSEVGIETGEIDGLIGPQTRMAWEQWQNVCRGVDLGNHMVSHQPDVFPRQKDAEKFYGKPGENHVRIELPYSMRLAWDKSVSVSKITLNKLCADSALRAFTKIHEIYGEKRLRELGLDLYGGSFNNRNMRGGSRKSMHAYAVAIDINPEKNRLRWGRDRAAMAHKDCAAFLDAFEAEGWISLGRERNFDWMHLQAARL